MQISYKRKDIEKESQLTEK